jgi:hypothetical protein
MNAWPANFALLGCLAFAPAALAQEARARLVFEPAAAAVGEPVHARLSLEHAASVHPTLESLGLDDSWVVLGQTAALDASDAAHPEQVTTSWDFEIASLEAGERKLTNVPLKLGDAKLEVESPALAVRAVLADDEDAPRALRGLRDIEVDDAAASNARTWIAAGAALACALAIAFLWWRTHKKPARVLAPSPSVRLAQLEAAALDTPQDIQAAHFAMTRLLRESADLRAGSDRGGLTDEEWRAASVAQLDDAGFESGERQLLDQLLENASRVKYGSERPTHWATREALAHARGLALRFEAPLPALSASAHKREVAA